MPAATSPVAPGPPCARRPGNRTVRKALLTLEARASESIVAEDADGFLIPAINLFLRGSKILCQRPASIEDSTGQHRLGLLCPKIGFFHRHIEGNQHRAGFDNLPRREPHLADRPG